MKNIGNLGMNVPAVGCASHTLQSIKKGLECNSAIKVLIGGANRLVGHFKHSTVATKAKQQQMHCPKPSFILFCKTRWNSIFEMLERLIEARWPVSAVLSDRRYTKFSDAQTLDLKPEQWTLMEELVTCLKPLQVRK